MPTVRATRLPRWNLRRPDRRAVAALMRAEGIGELLAILLVNRGLAEPRAAREHLLPDLKRLHDPFLLPGMDAATARLEAAIEGGETILVHGDYDVDGVTGTALLVRLFRHLGVDAPWHIPHRVHDGYSFGAHSVRRARQVGASLVISVDNGTSAVETIGELAAAGVDTLVTDHHEPPRGDLPAATAIVNPKLAGSPYPFRELCGGAVAFKLAWGLCQRVSGGGRVCSDLRDFLIDAMGLVAVATVCDVVPLVDENRILARFGLKALEASPSPGVQALLEVAGLGRRRLGADDVGFQIGPRINASGRLASAAAAVEVLLADEPAEAQRLARELDGLNVERKRLERELTVQALAEAARFDDPERWPVTVVAGQGWHPGVVGIVASRLVDALGRPALVIALNGERGRGSARSVPGFSILEALDGGARYMERHGGHAQAAGCEVRAEAVDELREAVCDRARELDPEGRREPPLEIDAEVGLAAVNPGAMAQLERLEPHGEGNARPHLLSCDLRLAEPARTIGADRSHLLVHLRRGNTVFKALGFGMAGRVGELRAGVPVHAVYTPRWNTFRGERSLELQLVDFRITPGAGGTRPPPPGSSAPRAWSGCAARGCARWRSSRAGGGRARGNPRPGPGPRGSPPRGR